ncbi:MAG: hypothetical protein A3I05_09385 [Deltaproteobacteria bacterium RIFCSPLOWO2_02_FULL_44_10]|nr:MAG: hypothetical protein A3C46_07595 [Deltaproteobacteria bacterium RIFCSPHIGHO2_02_FULL_44_16]OGQ47424.1 MAG: hypothetical protein A3I05_09385 [Deltaproteobacteria bacterium RIFCSPLOWO2_02_FULL_44_10]
MNKMNWKENQSEAAGIIKTCCPHAGSSSISGRVVELLQNFSSFLLSENECIYGNRRREHIAFAIDLFVSSPPFRPGGAVATPYLVTQIEYSL